MLSSRMHASTFEMICDAYILITIIRVHAPVQSHGADQLVSAIGSYGGLWRSAGGRREPGAAPAPVSPEQGQRRPARGHGRTPTSAPTEPQASPPRSPRRPNGSPCSPPPAPPRASWSWPPPMTRATWRLRGRSPALARPPKSSRGPSSRPSRRASLARVRLWRQPRAGEHPPEPRPAQAASARGGKKPSVQCDGIRHRNQPVKGTSEVLRVAAVLHTRPGE